MAFIITKKEKNKQVVDFCRRKYNFPELCVRIAPNVTVIFAAGLCCYITAL
jgi:hypothetical protein